ncbi:hypothetical protein SO802_033797 [Lithocarpus litseifolius]|uniref:F5/8 type C domain-containing protein n=1 Tax=Lithocarpus litseifolius TaxID=425828 RepID=A0AAW2BG46_9ROSI
MSTDGPSTPKRPLRAYAHVLQKDAPYGDNHPSLYQIFLDSLTSPVAIQYVRLEKTSSWREMANSFLEYYRFNTKIAPDRTVLMKTEKKSRESFREYAQRWQELAAQVQTPYDGKWDDQMVH